MNQWFKENQIDKKIKTRGCFRNPCNGAGVLADVDCAARSNPVLTCTYCCDLNAMGCQASNVLDTTASCANNNDAVKNKIVAASTIFTRIGERDCSCSVDASNCLHDVFPQVSSSQSGPMASGWRQKNNGDPFSSSSTIQ